MIKNVKKTKYKKEKGFRRNVISVKAFLFLISFGLRLSEQHAVVAVDMLSRKIAFL